MSLYPCAPDPQAAIVHAAKYGDTATVKRILQKGVVPDAALLSPSSHTLTAAGVLPDLLSAGLSPLGLSPLAQDTWLANAALSDPQSIARMLRAGWRMSVDTRHILESFAATRGGQWEAAVRDIQGQIGELPAGFSLTSYASRIPAGLGAARRVDAAGSRWWADDS